MRVRKDSELSSFSMLYALLASAALDCGDGTSQVTLDSGDLEAVATKDYALTFSTHESPGPDDYDTDNRGPTVSYDPPPETPAASLSCPLPGLRPNILLIVADDLGYSDIHAFGGEIDTPNLDTLVANGRILTNHPEDGVYVQPGQPGQPGGVGGTPEVFYSTDFYTQKLIEYIDSNHGDGKPFFAFASYTSPHWPLQVPEPWLSMYKGRYDQGYDAVRAARIDRMKRLGIIPPWMLPSLSAPETLTQSEATPNYGTPEAQYISAVHSPADGYADYRSGIVNKKWNSLSELEKKAQARYMEIYAGMVSNLDHNIGLLIQHLKDIGEYDSTFIMFHSDNGAEGWPIDWNAGDPKATDEANAAPELPTDAAMRDQLRAFTRTSLALRNALRTEHGFRVDRAQGVQDPAATEAWLGLAGPCALHPAVAEPRSSTWHTLQRSPKPQRA